VGVVDYELQVCVIHWRILRAWRREPWANFGFKLCPIEEGTEHEVVNFVSVGEDIEWLISVSG
jgi:hypothetical protein